MSQRKKKERFAGLRKAWSVLTWEEQKAVIIVLSLLLLGLTTKLWHHSRGPSPITHPTEKTEIDQ